MLAESQANLWNLLKADATIAGITKNVLDGVPVGLTQGTGFPYVIVPTPVVDEESYLTFSKKQETITFKVEIFDRKESVLRQLCDAIRSVCETNKMLFKRSYGMMEFKNARTSITYVVMEDNAIVYNYTMELAYEWIAW
jgi:hypothetical protein